MKKYNRIELKGNLGRDASVQTVNGRQVANFSVATEYVYKNRAGEFESETTWLNVCAWEGSGICPMSLLVKGAKVSVTGRMRSRTYTDKSGSEKEILEVLADTCDAIYEPDAEKPAKQARNAPNPGVKPQPGNPINQDDDLPF